MNSGPISKRFAHYFSLFSSHFSRNDFLGAITAGLLVVFFCLLLLWHNPQVFWNDDYQLSVLPVFADMARSWSESNWPILSPYSWVCGNLAGEFQYGTFSLFINAAVVLIWEFPFTFSQQAAALSIAHLFALALGAFLLARDRRLSIALSMFVALIAALSGWIICWGATDWFGALGAFAWLPWTWWGAERALDPARTKWRWLWPAPFVYLLVTGGFPYTVLMLFVLVGWLSVKSLTQTKNVLSVWPMLVGVALGLGLSAPAWLALLEQIQGSARELQSPSAHWQWLVPPTALPGLILPCWTVHWADFSTRYLPHTATELACGFVAPGALVAGFVWRGRILISRLKWELILLLIVIILAMVPTAGLFRWSFRWLPFFHLILAVCAAEALQLMPRTLVTAAIVFVVLVFTAAVMLILRIGGSYAFPLTGIFIGLAAGWFAFEFWFRNSRLRFWVPVAITFCALLATYLCLPTNCGVPRYHFSKQLLNPAPLDPQRLYLSIYPWAELTYATSNKPQPVGQTLRPGSTSMWARLHFVNGYSPIRPAGVAREFSTSIHGEINPEVGSYLLTSQAGRDGQLALMGVDGIVVATELDMTPQPSSDWDQIISTDEGRVFHRHGGPFPRVRSVRSIDSRPNEQFVSANVAEIDNLRNRVEADVDVPSGDLPALLIFSRPYFRGYEARLGNRKLTVASHRGLFPMVEIPAGTHGRLILEYRPYWLIGGGVVAMVCALFVVLGVLAATLRHA